MITNHSGKEFECGIDEAGRGSFLGRLYVGAVIFPKEIELDSDIVKDSKKFHSRKKREKAAEYVKTHALCYNVAWSEPEQIDSHGIGRCLTDTIHRCITGLTVKPEFLIIDGDRYQPDMNNQIPYELKIKGDSTYFSIAAASILAKVAHDEHILELLANHPELREYQLETNMGYGTSIHRQALKRLGLTPYHRKTFCEKTLGLRIENRQKCLI